MAAHFAGPFRRIANAHRRAIRRRGAKIASAKRECLLWILLWLAVRPFPQGIGLIRDKVLNFVTAFMRADLVRHDMIEGWELPPSPLDGDDIRLVLAELINPSYDLRNVAGLCTAAALDRAKAKAALTLGQSPAATGKNFESGRRHGPMPRKAHLYAEEPQTSVVQMVLVAILRLAIRLGFWPQTFRHLVIKTGGGQARRLDHNCFKLNRSRAAGFSSPFVIISDEPVEQPDAEPRSPALIDLA